MNNTDKKLENLRLFNEESNRITKECIQTSLIYLMNKKEIEEITITEIVEKSGVSRSAFYRNYQTKEDVLIDFAQNVFDLLSDSLNNERFRGKYFEWFKFLFRQIKSNEKTFRLLLRAHIDFSTKIIRGNNEYTQLEEYKIIALEKGLGAIIEKWMENNMQESIEEMAKLSLEIFDQIHILIGNEKKD